MSVIRSAIKKTLGFSFRFVPEVRRALERSLTVFVFHEVSDHPSEFAKQYDLAISTRTFRRQICWIQSNFNVVHPTDLLRGMRLPNRAALISFDDGFLGSFENVIASYQQDPIIKAEDLQKAYQCLLKADQLARHYQEVTIARAATDMAKGDYRAAQKSAEACIALNADLGQCYFIRALSEI